MLIRVLITGNAELDEADQIVWCQQFHLGYGADLPLYTWLQALFFAIFGTNILAVSLLRSVLLFVVFFFTSLNAREITGCDKCAVAAPASLMLIPMIFWESQRILTNMVLAMALVAVSIFLFIRLYRTGRVYYYFLFGLSTGLGMLTKYNFGIFLTALIIAACSSKVLRDFVVNRRIIIALAAFLLVISLPSFWVITHLDAAMAKAVKLHPGQDAGLLKGYLSGFAELAKSVAGFLIFIVPFIYAIFAKAPKIAKESKENKELRNLLGKTVIISISICVLLVLFFHVTHFKSRWLLPLLFPIPLYIIALVQERVGVPQLRMVTASAVIIAFLVLVAMPARIVLASYIGSQGRMNFPYDLLAIKLRSSGFSRGVIVTDSNLLGGNLRLRFPESSVTVTTGPIPFTLTAGVPLLIVWDATGSSKVPGQLFSVAGSSVSFDEGKIRYVEAPSLYFPRAKVHLGFILIQPGVQKGSQPSTNGKQ